MNALVVNHALASEEVDLMVFILGSTGGLGSRRNKWWIGPRQPEWPMIRSLVERGMLTVAPAAVGAYDVSVTTTGARELVRIKAVSIGDLAADVDRILGLLQGHIRYRDDLRARHGDAVADDFDVWDYVPDEPFARVAAAILIKRGLVEQRGPETDREHAWAPHGLLISARAA
ncbi:hypothetical protein ACFPIF_10380 [Brevundimonas faecalis]|uniref:hypothetical protein n=1 Tax=Brevundimonas faecalis TaxID=947378 RepID=UPI00361D6041